MNEVFQKAGKRFSAKNRKDGLVSARSFDDNLSEARNIVRESGMFKSLCESIQEYELTCIRCLALGSFHEDVPARFQLALLLELCEQIKQGRCSLYDPVFSNKDVEYINSLPNWSVDEVSPFSGEETDKVLFFLPHAPLDLTETVISAESPRIWLANNLVQHTDRYTKIELYRKYPKISKLVHYIGRTTVIDEMDSGGFQPFSSKKRKSGRNKYKEPVIDYTTIYSYFADCLIVNDFEGGSLLQNQPWLNSFSDLTLHFISI